MLHVTLRQLEYIVAVGKAGSLSTASHLLNVSQPALSVAISQVEARIGERLFLRRKGAATALTAYGRLFLQEAERLLAAAGQLERPGALAGRTQSRVTIGILDELAPRWMAPILSVLRSRFPDTESRVLPVSFAALADALLSGSIDIALSYDLGLDATFQRSLLLHAAPHVWVAPDDPIAGRGAVTLADIADRPLILSDQDLSIQHMLGLFRRIGATPVVRHRAASIELLRSLAANGEGTGLSYTNPAGLISTDGRPLARLRVSDPEAVEPVVLAQTGPQPAPVPQICAALQDMGRSAQADTG
jgi:DNA-binding transcriptional LysR family regulator